MLNTILAELYDKKCREDCVNRTMDFDDCMNDCHKPTSQYISNGGSSSGGGSSGGGGNSTTPPTQEQVSCASKCADDCLKTHPG